jgi:4-carboxymuconolactone decarboxylase
MKSKSRDPLYATGLRARKEVLGADYVKQRQKNADAYTARFDEFSTQAAWGLVWSRKNLSRKSRSLLTLGILTALGQQQELRLHINAALRHGLTRDEIAEALLHATVYCGFPRGADARRSMVQVFAELDGDQPPRRTASKSARRAASR